MVSEDCMRDEFLILDYRHGSPWSILALFRGHPRTSPAAASVRPSNTPPPAASLSRSKPESESRAKRQSIRDGQCASARENSPALLPRAFDLCRAGLSG